MKTESISIYATALNIASISHEQMQAIADGLTPSILPSVRQHLRLSKLQTQAQMHLKHSLFAPLDRSLHPVANHFGKLMRRKALCYCQFRGRYLQLKARRMSKPSILVAA